jgi:hypothetical protein
VSKTVKSTVAHTVTSVGTIIVYFIQPFGSLVRNTTFSAPPCEQATACEDQTGHASAVILRG